MSAETESYLAAHTAAPRRRAWRQMPPAAQAATAAPAAAAAVSAPMEMKMYRGNISTPRHSHEGQLNTTLPGTCAYTAVVCFGSCVVRTSIISRSACFTSS